MATTQAIQVLTICTALFTSGGIAALSGFDIPLLRSQPASRSLPLLRWLFSRGSHAAPTGIMLSSAGFLYLSLASLPSAARTLKTALPALVRGKPGIYLAASALSLSTAVFTSVAMIPTNFELIRINEELGGSKSAQSAQYRESIGAKPRTAEQSVNGKEDISQWSDVSGPQSKTVREATREQEERVQELLKRFGRLNYVRATLMGVGGAVGLVGALV
ncbi:hypothetical protein SVAN01_04155 [Stagonosporopsis vannaccii]|nr:hypothetical protein SVAN01_04155 [Stagonosporopsis vannaccii]